MPREAHRTFVVLAVFDAIVLEGVERADESRRVSAHKIIDDSVTSSRTSVSQHRTMMMRENPRSIATAKKTSPDARNIYHIVWISGLTGLETTWCSRVLPKPCCFTFPGRTRSRSTSQYSHSCTNSGQHHLAK